MTRRRSRTLYGSLPDDLGVGRHPHHSIFLLLDEQTQAVADVLQQVLRHVDRQARLGDGVSREPQLQVLDVGVARLAEAGHAHYALGVVLQPGKTRVV